MIERQPNDLAKTLERGLQVLELLAEHHRGATLAEAAKALGLHRTVAHRLLATLEKHGYVRRDTRKVFHLGYGVVRLAAFVDQDLRSIADPVLQDLAAATKATANLGVPDGDNILVLSTVEPRGTDLHLVYRAGFTHPITVGSAGLAILALRAPEPGERPTVTLARERGYAISNSEIMPHTIGVSVGIRVEETECCIGVSIFDEAGIEAAAAETMSMARRLTSLLR